MQVEYIIIYSGILTFLLVKGLGVWARDYYLIAGRPLGELIDSILSLRANERLAWKFFEELEPLRREPIQSLYKEK